MCIRDSITTDPEDITYGKSDVCYELIRAMQLVGINVITRTEVEMCIRDRILSDLFHKLTVGKLELGLDDQGS